MTSSAKMAEKFKSSKKMSLEEIVKKDVATNGKRLGYTLKEAAIMLNNFKKNNATFRRVGNTLFVITNTSNGVVTYHAINGDPLKALLYNCVAFFAYLADQGNKQAKTYFSDPFTQKLVTKYKLKNETIAPSDDPQQGKMMLVTNLTRGS